MKLTVVGCSGSFPGPDSPASCYLLEHDGHRIVLDLGNGSLGQLAKYVDVCSVDAVVISHLHVDHFIDLCSYHVARKYRPEGSAGPIPVYAPTGAGQQVAAAYGFARADHLATELDFRSIDSAFEVGPFLVEATPVVHPVASFAIRVTAGGRTLTYSGDTGACPALIEAARDCDVALFEASFLSTGDNPRDLHLTGKQAGEHAAQAGAGRLVVTHLVPWNDDKAVLAEAQAAFPGACDLAYSGLQIDV